MSDNKAMRGSVSQIVLKALKGGDKYGYEICKEIEDRSNGALVLKQPSLYSSLRRMEDQGLISSYWQDSEIGGRRHYYKLTDKGSNFLSISNGESDIAEPDNTPSIDNSSIDNAEDMTSEPSDIAKDNDALPTLDNNTPTLDNNLGIKIVKQESLFNLKPRAIPQVEESDNNTYVQFDLFNTAPSFVKSSNNESINPQQFMNKYADEDKHSSTIQPSSNTTKYDKINITTNNDELLDALSHVDNKSEVMQDISIDAIDKTSSVDEFEPDIDKSARKDVHIDMTSIHEDKPQHSSIDFSALLNSVKIEPEDIELTTPTQPIKVFDDQVDENKPKIESRLIDNNIYLKSNMENLDNYSKDDYNLIKYNTANGPKATGEYILKKSNNPNKPTEYYMDVLQKIYTPTKIDITAGDEQEEPLNTPTSYVDEDDDTLSLANNLRSDGIRLRQYNKINKKFKPTDNFISYNKLRIVQGWSIYGLMLAETWIVYMILALTHVLVPSHINLYIIASCVTLLYPGILTIIYLVNPDYRIESNYRISIGLFTKLLATLITIVFIFSITLFLGMTTLNQIDYLSYWLLPTVLSTNYLTSAIMYYLLLKCHKFHY